MTRLVHRRGEEEGEKPDGAEGEIGGGELHRAGLYHRLIPSGAMDHGVGRGPDFGAEGTIELDLHGDGRLAGWLHRVAGERLWCDEPLPGLQAVTEARPRT